MTMTQVLNQTLKLGVTEGGGSHWRWGKGKGVGLPSGGGMCREGELWNVVQWPVSDANVQ